jgi:hypothetical protein
VPHLTHPSVALTDERRARNDHTRRFVARAIKLGEPLKPSKMLRGKITGVLPEQGKNPMGVKGFIGVELSDGKTEYSVS